MGCNRNNGADADAESLRAFVEELEKADESCACWRSLSARAGRECACVLMLLERGVRARAWLERGEGLARSSRCL